MVHATKMREIKLTPEQEAEIEAWAKAELDRDGEITKEEAWDALVAFCNKHGFALPTEEEKAWLEKQFDRVDTNSNGAIDAKELEAAIAHVKKHGVDLKAMLKTFAHKMREIKLTPEQEAEIEAWAKAELDRDGEITKKEAWDALVAFCNKHGFALPTEEEKEWLEKQFDRVDTNSNGAIDAHELKAAMKNHGE